MRIEWSPYLSQCTTPDNPIILRVSHESREEGLRTYRPAFATTPGSKPVVYANFSLDTVDFDWVIPNSQLSHFTHGELNTALKDVKSLTIRDVFLQLELVESWRSLLAEFSELEVLIVSNCLAEPDRPLISNPEAMEEDIRTSIFMAGEDENSDAMPKLVCLKSGYECSTHWWFKQCNEWCPRRMGRGSGESEKPNWLSIFSSVSNAAMGYSIETNI